MKKEYYVDMARAMSFQAQAEVAEAAAWHAQGDMERWRFNLGLAERSTKLSDDYKRMAEMGE